MIRRKTLVGGAVLGVTLFGALTIAGIMGAVSSPRQPTPVKPAKDNGTMAATQAELEQALIRPADLPKPFASASKATIRRLPPAESCAALLDPTSLVRQAAQKMPQVEATDQASTHLDGPAQLTQLLTTFAGNGAEAALRELREVGKTCKQFGAVLDDGTPVQVSAAPVRDDMNGYTIKLTLTGGGRITSGYVTLGRVGQVLSVLREIGSVDAVAAIDPVKLVDLTLSRLTQPR